uniref:Putative ORF2 n=1 Tax=Po-Circo-like virus 51 TaxID=1105386 RepID=A0A8G1GL99_9VIRU|nr:putative ORF2 [Po-Circo-like virus 51]
MYNRNYYSRRGRTIERKKTEVNPVIRPELVNVYYNYLKDNGLIPEPPAPIEDGSYVTYHIDQVYSFPISWTSLNAALGNMIDTFELPVDITEVDSIRLEYTLTASSPFSSNHRFNGFSSSETGSSSLTRYDFIPPSTTSPVTYVMFFYRTGPSTFVALFYDDIGDKFIAPVSPPLSYVVNADRSDSTMVVKSITVSTYANE